MKLSYVSIDIETTGLDPETCQILEFGAVFDNWTKPIEQLPRFHRYVVHPIIVGDPFALAMNAQILGRIGTDRLAKVALTQPLGLLGDFCRPEDLASQFSDWMFRECGWLQDKITPAGKNFASFDRNFLLPLGFTFFHHRTLDPAPLYWRPEDEKLPDTKTCMLRAGMDGKVAHTAVEDALAVVQLIRQAAKIREPVGHF